MTGPLRILSVDGGGIRGLIPALVLDRLEKELAGQVGPGARLSDYGHAPRYFQAGRGAGL